MLYCRFCGEEFKSPKDLKKHEKKCEKENSTNYDESPYDEKFVCRNCHKTFYSKDEFKKHTADCNVSRRIDENSVE